MTWAIKWRSKNKLDGDCSHLIGFPQRFPANKSGYTTMCFETRDYVNRLYSYIKGRKDLKEEPHGWKMPKVVKVSVTVKEIDT